MYLTYATYEYSCAGCVVYRSTLRSSPKYLTNSSKFHKSKFHKSHICTFVHLRSKLKIPCNTYKEIIVSLALFLLFYLKYCIKVAYENCHYVCMFLKQVFKDTRMSDNGKFSEAANDYIGNSCETFTVV